MKTRTDILTQIAGIKEMEKGTLCPMRGGRYFNHQTWQDGRNVVRYVPADELAVQRRRIDAYRRFTRLVEEYVDLVVRQTRERNPRAKDRAQTRISKRGKTSTRLLKNRKESTEAAQPRK